MLLDRFPGLESRGSQSAEGHPLARIQHVGQHGQFARDLQRAGLSNASRGQNEA